MRITASASRSILGTGRLLQRGWARGVSLRLAPFRALCAGAFCVLVSVWGAGCSRSEPPAKGPARETNTVVKTSPEVVGLQHATNRPPNKPDPVGVKAAQERRDATMKRLVEEGLPKVTEELQAVTAKLEAYESSVCASNLAVKMARDQALAADRAYQEKRAALPGMAEAEKKRDELKASLAGQSAAPAVEGAAPAVKDADIDLRSQLIALTKQIHEIESSARQSDEGLRTALLDRKRARATYEEILAADPEFRSLAEKKLRLQSQAVALTRRSVEMTQEKN